MKKGLVLLFAFLVIGFAGTALAEVNVNINIGSPPPVLVSEPQLVLTPFGIYFVQGVSYDLFFYNNYWWSRRGNRWYRAREYNSPWSVLEYRVVPQLFFKMPGDYRIRYKKERPINYGQLKKQLRNNAGGQQKVNLGQPQQQGGQPKVNLGQPQQQGGQPKMQGQKKQGRGGKR